MNIKQLIISGLGLYLIVGTMIQPADARRYNHRYDRRPTYFSQHPYVKNGLIGAGAGAGVGALVSRDGNRVNGATKGAVIGGAAGLGLQYLKGHR